MSSTFDPFLTKLFLLADQAMVFSGILSNQMANEKSTAPKPLIHGEAQ